MISSFHGGLNRGHPSRDKLVVDDYVPFSFSSRRILIFVALAPESGTVTGIADSAVCGHCLTFHCNHDCTHEQQAVHSLQAVVAQAALC